jgi:hypothetical protein
MAWYKTGSVSLTNGSNAVTGIGTDFVSNVSPGGIFCAPDGHIYEVNSVASATALTLVANYAGMTAANAPYAIAPTQSYIVDLAAQASSLLNTFGGFRDAYLAGDLVGAGLQLKGVLTDPSLLPASGATGDAYLIGSSLYVWVGTTWKSSSIQGQKGDVGDVNPANLTAEANALASQNAAAASATTASAAANAATTQAGIATTQASTATTQAGIGFITERGLVIFSLRVSRSFQFRPEYRWKRQRPDCRRRIFQYGFRQATRIQRRRMGRLRWHGAGRHAKRRSQRSRCSRVGNNGDRSGDDGHDASRNRHHAGKHRNNGCGHCHSPGRDCHNRGKRRVRQRHRCHDPGGYRNRANFDSDRSGWHCIRAGRYRHNPGKRGSSQRRDLFYTGGRCHHAGNSRSRQRRHGGDRSWHRHCCSNQRKHFRHQCRSVGSDRWNQQRRRSIGGDNRDQQGERCRSLRCDRRTRGAASNGRQSGAIGGRPARCCAAWRQRYIGPGGNCDLRQLHRSVQSADRRANTGLRRSDRLCTCIWKLTRIT